MSLQVWLPLNGTLENKGLSDVSITNNGATVNAAGKIGSCYAGTTTSQTIVATLPGLSDMLANGKCYSLACWVKVVGSATNGWCVKLGTNSCGLWWAKSEARWVWNENDNGKRCANPTVSGDTSNWYHLVNVVDKTDPSAVVVEHYVNGEPAEGYNSHTIDMSSLTQPAGDIITVTPYIANVNDLRIYDHCLSQKEVKELSKGLIGHWPLNDFSIDPDTTIAYDTSGYERNALSYISDSPSDTPRYSSCMYFNGTNTDYVSLPQELTGGRTINQLTCSIWFKTDTLNSVSPNLFSLCQNGGLRVRITYGSNGKAMWFYSTSACTGSATTADNRLLIDNTWHHFTIIFDTGIVKMYIDSEEIYNETFSSYQSITFSSSGENILAGYTSSGEKYKGSLSDFRIYCTALTAEDIKELYETAASVDSNGDFWGYELSET